MSTAIQPTPRHAARRPADPGATGPAGPRVPTDHPETTRNRVVVRRGVLAAAVLVAVVLHGATDEGVVFEATYLGVLVCAAVAAWWGAALAPAGDRLVPVLIAAGVSLSALGDVLWALLDRLGAVTDVQDVSVADLAWGASYVALCAATWVVLSHDRVAGRTGLDSAIDVLTIVVVGVVVLWRSSVEAIVADPDTSALDRWVTAAYPIADAVLLALVARVLMTARSRRRLGAFFAVGACLWLGADFAYLLWPADRTAVVLMDAGWMLAPVLLACATWVRHASVAEPPADRETRVSIAQLLVAVGPLLVPPALEVVADLQGRPDRPFELLVGMVALAALALVRTARLLRSERQAHLELERTRDAALEASQAKSVFLANVGHEIRTPLTTVLAAAELLGDTPLDDTQARLLSRMQRCGELLRDLVERILDFSRLAAGEIVLQATRFDPSVLVADLVDGYRDRARSQGLDFDWYVDPRTPPTMTADLVRLFQVLTNLLDNAFKFTPDGGVRLEVRPGDETDETHETHETHEVVSFVVLDTGIGIREEDQHLVFDLFKQVDESATRSHGGSGLGLAICKELATAMGGTITVSSRAGGGSRFELRLPAEPLED